MEREHVITGVSQKRVALRKSLSLGYVLRLLPHFVPAKADEDVLQLGWRLADPGSWPSLDARNVHLMSAEAIAALGTIHGTFPGQYANTITTLSDDQGPCERIINALRRESGPWELLPGGGASMLLQEVDLTAVEEVERVVDQIVLDLLSMPGEAGRDLVPLREVLRRLLTEALMNVHEHAYARGTKARTWLAAVCLPAAAIRHIHPTGIAFTNEEREWLETVGERQILELAIADAGVGIPATLSPSAASLLPSLVGAAKSLSSGRKDFSSLRSKIHTELCSYAFHHSSTSRGTDDKKFPSEHHKRNWRGLYRCYRQVAELGGTISVTSGRGRAGYASTKHGACGFETEIEGNDFPGTLLSVRLPISIPLRGVSTIRPSAGNTFLKLTGATFRWDKLVVQETHQGSSRKRLSTETEFSCVSLPFVHLTPDPDPAKEYLIAIQELRIALEPIQPHLVPIFCFGAVPEGWRDNLRAFVSNLAWHATLHGPPRLVGVLGSNQTVQWAFAGAIPEEAEYAITHLECEGRWEMPTQVPESVRKLFTEVHAHYRDILTWDLKTRTFCLLTHNARLRENDYKEVLASAFSQYWQLQSVRREVVTEFTHKLILLPNGTQVRRHFSVFKLLNQSPDLTIALGRRFGDLVRETIPCDNALIVLDRPASSYIAHALLEGADVQAEVLGVEQLRRRKSDNSSILVFADCIYNGETVKQAVNQLQNLGYRVARVVACADLRAAPRSERLDNIPFSSLVYPDGFKPEVVSQPLEERNIVRTDALTHAPVSDIGPSSFIQLTDHKERRRLLIANPGLICVGFQHRGGRTHTYSLPFNRIVELEAGKQTIADWLCEMVTDLSNNIGSKVFAKDVVIFTWLESRMSGVAEFLAERLREACFGATGTFVVRMPLAHRGSDTTYPHAGSNPLVGCVEVATGRLAYAGRRSPSNGYLAIYLADSVVTGNSLRDFLHRLTTAADPAPDAAMALIGINRLSPAEIRFFNLCQTLSRPHGRTSLPFRHDSLFRLQIRSRAGEGTAWHPLLDSIFADPAMRVGRLRGYIEHLQERTSRLDSTRGLRHLLCPTDSPSDVSADAVQFRHLLAINQQNESVVPEILALLERLTAKETEDPSVLIVLALEPGLLTDQPLRHFGRAPLIALAIRMVERPDVAIGIRTDALVVLASYPGALHRHLPAAAEAVLADKTLQLTIAVLSLTLQRLSAEPAQALIESCYASIFPETRVQADHLCHLLAVCTDIQHANAQPDRDHTLRRVVMRLGCHMLHHAAALENEWDGVGTELDLLATRWTSIAKPARRASAIEACRRGIGFCRDTLLPSFHALAYFARGLGEPRLASRLEDDAVRARSLIADIGLNLPEVPEAMTQVQAISLDAAFQALRCATWFGPTSEQLLRGVSPEPGSGPLAECLPRLFAAPADLLVLVADEVFGSATEIETLAEMTAKKASPQLTVAPVPVKSLRQIFFLLLTNIREHGIAEKAKVSLRTTAAPDGSLIWSLEIINPIRKDPHAGQRQGVDTAKGVALPFGIEVDSREIIPNRKWRTSVKISHCFYLHKLAESRLP